MKESPDILNNQALEFASKGEYKEAIACFQRAIEIERFNYMLWYNLGITYRDSGQMQAAKEALEQAYKINDTDQDVLETLALVNFNLGDYEEALRCCNEGLLFGVTNARLWNMAGVIYFNTNKYDLACEAFEHAVTINPYYYDALYNLRDTYDELGNEAGKLQCIEQMKNLSPSQSGGFVPYA